MPEADDLSEGRVTNADAVLPNFKAEILQRQDKRQRYILCFAGTLTVGYAVLFTILFLKILCLLENDGLGKADWHFFLFGSILALIPAWMTSRLLNSVFNKEDVDEITPVVGLARHALEPTHH